MNLMAKSTWVPALALLWIAVPLAAPADAAGKDPIVYCFDADRDQVAQMRSETCKGEIVSAEKAEEIKERRRQRIMRIMKKGTPKPLLPGTRLASVGTGFFVTRNGHMLTNNHVINKCKAVSVETPQGQRLRAKVLDRNVAFDLALVRVNFKPANIAVFRNPPDLVQGEAADLVGYPTQGIPPIQPIHTRADLFKDHAMRGDRSRFQIRGDVRGGNSGGPVLDRAGLTIGVIFAQLNSALIFKRTGKVPDDIGIAVSNSVALEFLRRNAVDYQQARNRKPMKRDRLLNEARSFIARMGCWR